MDKLIIAGAGASYAISKTYPLMDGFFGSVLNNSWTEEEQKQLANAFATFDLESLFPIRVPSFERLAEEYLSANPESFQEKKDKYLKSCKERFTESFNLENVIQWAYEAKKTDSISSILFLINLVFSKTSSEIETKANDVYHELFDRFIGKEKVCTIVSLNYDLVIDRAMFDWLKKDVQSTDTGPRQMLTRTDALQGYLIPKTLPKDFLIKEDVDWAENLPEATEFSGNGMDGISKMLLCKPHGSISFYKHSENDPEKRCYLLLKKEGDDWNFDSFQNFETIILDPAQGRKRFPKIEPLIVPPAENKIKSYPILFESERTFLQAIAFAKKIVIIGWSLPETDQDHLRAIRNKVLSRNVQIEELTVFDKRESQDDKYFDRVEAIFQPRNMKRFHEGFSKEAVAAAFS